VLKADWSNRSEPPVLDERGDEADGEEITNKIPRLEGGLIANLLYSRCA
jgi:hypothetical protein